MQWNFDNSAPIYMQLVEGIKLRIITGLYPLGERIPAVRELAVEAGVNPNTMQRALQELERMGLLTAHRTSGRFVTEDAGMIRAARTELAGHHIKGFLEQMSMLGFGMEEILELIEKERSEVYDAHSGMSKFD